MGRFWLAATILPLALCACDNAGGDDAAKYTDAMRCYNAAAAYSQQFVVQGKIDGARRMLGYAYELRAKAVALAAAQGKPESTVAGEFKGNDAGYLKSFYIFSDGGMTPTAFAASEVLYCNLNAVL